MFVKVIVMNIQLIKKYIANFILKLISRLYKVKDNQIAFIPYGGMAKEMYDLLNYKSDNTLSLLNYILNNTDNKYSLKLACDICQLEKLREIINQKYKDKDISVFPFFGDIPSRREKYEELMRSKYIFASQGIEMPYKKKTQTVVFLGYFKPFKDDYQFHHIELKDNFENVFDKCVSPSLLYSNIISHTYNISFSKFITLGFSRDDELLNIKPCNELERYIKNNVDYDYKKVFLYTPTHRDYESNLESQRSILGFEYDKKSLGDFLESNGIVIICKIHSNQNNKVINESLPKGVILHNPNSSYGLCELMQRADCLITDYTSVFFDFILLNRPVIFNFYDFDKYKQSRGFSYDPIEPILAGEVVYDEKSFYDKMQLIISGVDQFKNQREWVRDLMHANIDNASSKRIYRKLLA